MSHSTLSYIQHIYLLHFQVLMAVFDYVNSLPVSGQKKLLTKPLAFKQYISTGTVLLQFVMRYEACKSMVYGYSNMFV